MQTMDIDKDTYANKPRKKDYIGVTFSANFQWWKRPSGVAAVCLGLLCVLLLAGIIGLSVYYNRIIGHYYSAERFQTSSLNNLTKERDQLKTSYNTLTKERDELQTRYNTLTKERDQLQTRYNTLTKESDQLQNRYNNLTKERDQLQTRYNTLTKGRDQLQTRYNNLTKERDPLQNSYNTLTKERDQLQTSYNNQTKERDQLQTRYNTLTKEKDQLRTSSNTLTKERDQLQTSSNTLTKERDQLQTSYHTLTKEKDQLQTSYNTLTKERDQLQTSYHTLTKEKDQLQTSYNTLTKERDQLQTGYNTLTKERDHLKEELNKQSSGWQKFESSWYYLSTEKKSWTESRQDCLKRGAHLVIINSKKEQEFIHEWSGCLDIYLGFHDTNTEGVWEWINDGALGQSSAPGTTYWRDGEPNDADQGEDCAQLSKKVSDPLKSWNDVPCTTTLHWMCEKTPSTFQSLQIYCLRPEEQSTMVVSKAWTLHQHFQGFPKASDFHLREETLPQPRDGQVLLEAVFLSVDPYMRPYSQTMMKEGDVMIGSQVAKVIQSYNPSFPVGCHVVSDCGWRSHWVCDGAELTPVLPDWPQDIPLSLALGAIGMPGLTALYGLEEVCEIKKGETLLVNAAAGAVGSVVGQIAKIKGCRVVGCAGTDTKVSYLKQLGFDQVFNYKTVTSLEESLREAAPHGYDCYFENVGGKFSSVVMPQMREYGRIAVCGSISMYNDTTPQTGILSTPQTGPYVHTYMIFKQLRMEGFLCARWKHKHQQSLRRLMAWMTEGKLRCNEHITSGFNNMPAAFMGMLQGDNIGKAVVKV
ncbi:uncharacterized protein isoform X4 [Salmo salar]|uniref:Prostaglandin reductase 1 n=1 Tax=Salmo salar TaxID=8030 RepID=A0ABM3EMQ5_SALSA|nr:uncharacterized protein LOC106591609 isoform X4 [Salmo salar]